MTQDGGVDSPEALAKLIEGRTDEEITMGVKALGVDVVLERVFAGMVEHFLPEKAAGQSAVVQYDITVQSDVHRYQVTVTAGTCAFGKGAAKAPRVTLSMAVPDFLRIVSGRLHGLQAFMAGKLRLSGDMLFAQVMQGWFKPPATGAHAGA